MSALEEDPDHFVRWCRSRGMAVSAGTFVSRRGVEWEVAAVPDIRRQAAHLAQHHGLTARPQPTELVG